MIFNNLKLKLLFILFIAILFYIMFKLLHLFYLFKAEENVTKKLQKKYIAIKKKKKELQEKYWNIKYCNIDMD
jgi:hypothetical protein